MTTTWGQLSTTVAQNSDGDITNLLKKVREQYLAKAAEFEAKAFGENELEFTRVQFYYANCAKQIQTLIDQEPYEN